MVYNPCHLSRAVSSQNSQVINADSPTTTQVQPRIFFAHVTKSHPCRPSSGLLLRAPCSAWLVDRSNRQGKPHACQRAQCIDVENL